MASIRSARWTSFLLVLAVVAAGCDDGATALPDSPDPDDLLRGLLAEAGVRPLDPPPPEDPALVRLGRLLFFDNILSGNRNISCATCHHPEAATGDALPVSLGEGATGVGPARQLASGHLIPRNAPALFNVGVDEATHMFWDSRVRMRDDGRIVTPEPGLNGAPPELPDAAVLPDALSAQAMFPVLSPEEMRGQPGENPLAELDAAPAVWRALVERLVGSPENPEAGIEEYRELFRAAYPGLSVPGEVTFGHAARAVAAFERKQWTVLNSPFDRYLTGNDRALDEEEKRGAILFFGEAGCADCHNGPLLTDQKHHALAVPQLGPGKEEPFDDRGLGLRTGNPDDDYRFRTPPLRSVALTGPWMHDGAFTTLEGVVRHHLDPVGSLESYRGHDLPDLFYEAIDQDPARNAARIAALDPESSRMGELEDREVDALVAFLHALTDPGSANPEAVIPERVPSGLPVDR